MIAYVVTKADFGAVRVARLAAPEPDRALEVRGYLLTDCAEAILTDAGVSLEGPRQFILSRLVHDLLPTFTGRRVASTTLKQADVIAWAENLRAMIAPEVSA